MANRKMLLSSKGKEILDTLCDQIEVDRPLGIKLSLAKGIAAGKWIEPNETDDIKPKWTIPEGIIRNKEYILFKHLIINELNRPCDEEEIQKYMLLYIESGLRRIKIEIDGLSSLEDYRIKILE